MKSNPKTERRGRMAEEPTRAPAVDRSLQAGASAPPGTGQGLPSPVPIPRAGGSRPCFPDQWPSPDPFPLAV